MRRGEIVLSLSLLLLLVVGCVFYASDYRRQLWLTESDFVFLQCETDWVQIVEKLGEPDRTYGSGILYLEYDLASGYTAKVMYMGPWIATAHDSGGNPLYTLRDCLSPEH